MRINIAMKHFFNAENPLKRGFFIVYKLALS